MKRFLVFLSAAFLALPAHAVIIASGDGTGNTQAPIHDPGFANVGTIGSLSAVYLGNRWVLTANHVGVGDVLFEGIPYEPVLDTVHELVSPQGGSYPDPDLVLFQIGEDPGLPNLHIVETTPEAGTSLVMIGHGRNRGDPVLGADGILGWSWGAGNALRWGTNELRSSGFEISTNGWRTSVFSTDFSQDGTEFEAHGSNGDSGGAVYSGDELAGLMLALGPFFPAPDPALFGNYTYAADLARYRDQILAIVGPPPTCEVELDKTCCTSPQSGPGLFGETTCRPTGGTTGDDCQGRVLEMLFEYTGGSCTATTNTQEGKAKCEGSTGAATAAIVPDKSSIKANPSLVGVGETFSIRQKDGKDLGSTFKVKVIGSGTQKLEIHTSCSKDLNVGDQFGGLRLEELTTTEGGTVTEEITPVEFLDVCELPEAPPAPHCTTKVMALTLRYTGEDCRATSNTQEGKVKCSGDTAGSPAKVVITKDENKIAVDGVIGGTGPFAVGDSFTITNEEDYPKPEEDFKSSTKLRLDGSDGSQALTIHTSCSKQLDLGDRFGALEVVALDRKDRGLVSLGGTVEYQYKVSSPLSNTGPITVAVEDDPDVDDGDPTTVEIGSGIALDPGQEVTWFWAREASETTTNRATATALTDSLMCEAVDEVTVEMIPAGGVESFD